MGRVEKVLFAWLIATLAGVTAAGAYVVVEHATRCDRFDFDSAAWHQAHGDRNEIAHRLVECHRLEGSSAAEIRAQLGRPSQLHKWASNPGAVTWSYDAGAHEGFMFPVPQSLDVELSDHHVVRRVRLVDVPD